jgi:hypothetical protein
MDRAAKAATVEQANTLIVFIVVWASLVHSQTAVSSADFRLS